METMVAPSVNVAKYGVLFGSVTNLGSGSCGILVRRNLSWNSTLAIVTIEVVGTP